MELSQPRRFISSPWSSHKTGRNRILKAAIAPPDWLEPLGQRLLYTQTPNVPMITEFLANNANGIVDNHGHHSDWIELYNPQVASFDLSGYYLTDNDTNTTEWQFPQGTTMTGGSYMLVFASGDNETTLGQPFHTNFNLSAGGGYVGLIDPDGVTPVSDYQYPAQL